jgi:spore coat protein U-like protein
MRKFLLPLAAGALIAASASGYAANSSANFNAKIKINAGCTVGTSDLVWTATTLLTGTETATVPVSVTCTKTTPWALSLTNVTAYGSQVVTSPGTMTGAVSGDTINYDLSFTGASAATGTGAAQTAWLRGVISTTGGVTPDDYAEARTLYVVY